MIFKLMASKANNALLKEELEAVGFEISDQGPFIISENLFKESFIVGIINKQQFPLEYHSIRYFESFSNEINAYYKSQSQPYSIKSKLYHLEKGLASKGFIRVNKSQIINIRFIEEIEPILGQKLLLKMKDKTIIDVNRTYYKSFKNYLNI